MKQAPREQENNQKLSIRTAATAASEPIDEDFLLLWGIREEEDPIVTDDEFQSHSDSDSSSQQVHPFLSKLEEYFAKNILPFDYVEVWLPIHDQGKVSLCCGGGFVPEKNKASPELLHFATHLLITLTSDYNDAQVSLVLIECQNPYTHLLASLHVCNRRDRLIFHLF